MARGLSYYTGTVFEVYLKNSDVKTSVAAGGRYDKMVGNFLGGKREYPAVGISFGLDRIVLALKKEKIENVVKVYVIPIGVKEKAFGIVEKYGYSAKKHALKVFAGGTSDTGNFLLELRCHILGE